MLPTFLVCSSRYDPMYGGVARAPPSTYTGSDYGTYNRAPSRGAFIPPPLFPVSNRVSYGRCLLYIFVNFWSCFKTDKLINKAVSSSFIHPFVHSFICSFIRSSIHSFIHSSIHPFVCPFIHPFIRLFIQSSIHSFIHLFVHSSIYSFVHSFIRPFIHPFIRSSTHSFIYSFTFSHRRWRLPAYRRIPATPSLREWGASLPAAPCLGQWGASTLTSQLHAAPSRCHYK